MLNLLEREPLTARLGRRLHIEQEAERSGKSMRRHPHRLTAERLLIRPLLKAIMIPSGLYALGKRNALRPVIHRVKLEFRNLPSEFDGYRILHLSDLHIDALPDLARVVGNHLQEIDADLCVMTGDYRFEIEGPSAEAWRGMRRVLANISVPVYATLGNHDSCEMARALEQMGVELLINEAVRLRRGGDSIWLAGTDDPHDYRCADLNAALERVPQNAFVVVLAHSPDLYQEASDAGASLYLCGHTHAGQIRLPFIGSVVDNCSAPRAYTHGYWKHGTMHGYTSAGVGCSMVPVRFSCPPEIVVIELRRATELRRSAESHV
jgi:predicted MPP superfamily phosphohydrolase